MFVATARQLPLVAAALLLLCCSGGTVSFDDNKGKSTDEPSWSTPKGVVGCEPKGEIATGTLELQSSDDCAKDWLCAADRRGGASLAYCTKACGGAEDEPCEAGFVCNDRAGHCVVEVADRCEASACAEDNTCVRYQGETECRLSCSTQRGATGCPHNYKCISQEGQSFCVETQRPVERRAGQWGTPCDWRNGQPDPTCDQAQGFGCQFDGPNDPNAFCTLFNCKSDADCAGGYYCGEANYVDVDGRHELGDVSRMCLPRSFCAPCQSDIDCGPALDGSPQLCVADADGSGICVNRCIDNGNCNTDASCRPYDDQGSVCYPIAERCVGDGNLCSPCRSDKDCTGGGLCWGITYFDEKSCTMPAKGGCGNEDSCQSFDAPNSNFVGVGCTREPYEEIPADHCVGLVQFDASLELPGCYSRER